MTLVEILVGAAIFAIVAFILFGLVREFSLAGQRLSSAQHGRANLARLQDQWESEESSADSVFIPDRDVLGNDNASSPHEFDFFTRDASNRPYFWAYLYDATAQTLQRYDYGNIGATAVKDGPLFTGITRFRVSLHDVSEVNDAGSEVFMPIFASAADHNVPLGIGPKVIAGTHIVHVDITTQNDEIPIELVAGGAPSGFTVVLNYTPRPTPSASPGLLSVWPPAVEYPSQTSSGGAGTLVAMRDRRSGFPRDFGAYLNLALGGAIADAAGSFPACGVGQARAFTDGTFSVPLANSTGAFGVATDANGCYGGAVVAREPNYLGAFTIAIPPACPTLNAGAWSGGGPGPAMVAVSVGNVATTTACTSIIGDGTANAPVAMLVIPNEPSPPNCSGTCRSRVTSKTFAAIQEGTDCVAIGGANDVRTVNERDSTTITEWSPDGVSWSTFSTEGIAFIQSNNNNGSGCTDYFAQESDTTTYWDGTTHTLYSPPI